MLTEIEPDWLAPFLPPLGLPPAKPLRGLGRMVVLAGPNGSGKSRFLRAVRQLLEEADAVSVLASKGTSATEAKAFWAAEPRPSDWVEGADAPPQRQVAGLKVLERFGLKRRMNVCDLTQPINPTVRNASATNFVEQRLCIDGCVRPGLAGAYEHQHVFLESMARRLDLRNRQDFDLRHMEIDSADRFKVILDSLLRADFLPKLNAEYLAEVVLFNRPFDPDELSSGQKVLIAWAVALHMQSSLRDSIIMIDEPENHLHPDACIGALQSLRDKVLGDNGQLWIATHSVPVIAWAGAETLFGVERGEVSYAGNRVQHVINSLSGGADRRERLREFLAEADRFGFYHFVGQCLANPDVVEASNGDPQERVFAQFVSELRNGKGAFRVLDFGAGKGRLATAIARGSPDLSGLCYYTYDESDAWRAEREVAVAHLHELGASTDELRDLGMLRVKSDQVDLVVLCNVFHEIPPGEWLKLFRDIASVLREGGKLVIIEDQEPSVGELPHDKGFLLLNIHELAQLFGGDSRHVEDRSPGPNVAGGRISVACVSAAYLNLVSDANRSLALDSLRLRAISEVDRIRRASSAAQRDGRRHALYVMLAFNAARALEGHG